MCSLQGPLLVLGRGCALVFGRGAEVLGRYVCSTRASSFLPFLIKFLEASLEFRLLLNWFSQVLTFFSYVWDVQFESRSGKTNSKANQNSRLASKNFIKKGRNELARVEHT